MKIGILYICTGKYSIFWKDFYISCEKNFIQGTIKEYFVFTDQDNIFFEKENKNIHKIHQENLGWPFNTLMRFNMFLGVKKQLKIFDYVFFFNANLLFIDKIYKEEFLPMGGDKILAVLHPGFYNKKRKFFTYENRETSTAYIPRKKGTHYFAGGIMGGVPRTFLEASEAINKNIDIDKKNIIIARWHDESHWNKYLIDRIDIKIIDPSYLYPENWSLPFNKKILILDKNKFGGHGNLREEKLSLLSNILVFTKKAFLNLEKFFYDINKINWWLG